MSTPYGTNDSTAPFINAVAVTPGDATNIMETDSLYIGGAGAVAVRMEGGSNATFAAVPAGTTLNVRANRVLATGTTATNILALYRR
jgi:hypothetical protein